MLKDLFVHTDNQAEKERKAFRDLPSDEQSMLRKIYHNRELFTIDKGVKEIRTKALKKDGSFLKDHPDGKIWAVENLPKSELFFNPISSGDDVVVWCMSPLFFTLFAADSVMTAKLFQSGEYTIAYENMFVYRYKIGEAGDEMCLYNKTVFSNLTEFILVPYLRNKEYTKLLTYRMLKQYGSFFLSRWFTIHGNVGGSFYRAPLQEESRDAGGRMLDLMEFILQTDPDFFQEIMTQEIFTDMVLGISFPDRVAPWVDVETTENGEKIAKLKKMYRNVSFDRMPEDVFWHRFFVMKGLECDSHLFEENYLVEDYLFFTDNGKVKQNWESVTGRKLALDFRRIDMNSIMENVSRKDKVNFWERSWFNPDTGTITGDFFVQLIQLADYVYYPEKEERCRKSFFDKEFFLENCSEEQVLMALKKNFFRDSDAGGLITMAQAKGITAVIPALILKECGELKGDRNGKKTLQKRADA